MLKFLLPKTFRETLPHTESKAIFSDTISKVNYLEVHVRVGAAQCLWIGHLLLPSASGDVKKSMQGVRTVYSGALNYKFVEALDASRRRADLGAQQVHVSWPALPCLPNKIFARLSPFKIESSLIIESLLCRCTAAHTVSLKLLDTYMHECPDRNWIYITEESIPSPARDSALTFAFWP